MQVVLAGGLPLRKDGDEFGLEQSGFGFYVLRGREFSDGFGYCDGLSDPGSQVTCYSGNTTVSADEGGPEALQGQDKD